MGFSLLRHMAGAGGDPREIRRTSDELTRVGGPPPNVFESLVQQTEGGAQRMKRRRMHINPENAVTRSRCGTARILSSRDRRKPCAENASSPAPAAAPLKRARSLVTPRRIATRDGAGEALPTPRGIVARDGVGTAVSHRAASLVAGCSRLVPGCSRVERRPLASSDLNGRW